MFNNTKVKANILQLQRKVKFIKKQKRHTKQIYYKKIIF